MNFAAILTAISTLSSLLPTIESLVKQAETIIGSGNGSTKFTYVETAVNAFLAKAVADVEVLTNLQALIGPTITAIVAAFNIKGLFAKSAAPTPVQAV
jgi:hypothetical protein